MVSWKKQILQGLGVVILLAPGAAATGQDVPLQGKIVATQTSAGVADGMYLETYSLSGKLSPLGRVTGQAIHIPAGVEGSFVLYTGFFDLWGADGSSLTGTVELDFDITTFTFEERIRITGGSGRFDGALGSVFGQGVALNEYEVLEWLTGTISMTRNLP